MAASSLFFAAPSPLSTSAQRAQRASEGDHGTSAGPLASVRAPQRVSTPPSSGLAAVTPWPSPASSKPGSVFFSRAGEGFSRRPARFLRSSFPFYFPIPFFFLIWISFLFSELVIDLGFGIRPVIFSVLSFLSFLLLSSEWETRVRVRVPTLLFFFLWIFLSFLLFLFSFGFMVRLCSS